MINNWDVISRLNPQTGGLRYTLVTDGTEHDARLIAKKLQGFVQEPVPAVAPYVYAFELPDPMDEDTLSKIRTAAAEAAEQSRKVNEFVPGGVLGEPLFNADVSQQSGADEAIGTIDPADSFFRTPAEQETSSGLSVPDEAPGEITINDKDMLIKDMEGTLLDKMPLEDILSAETKFDMFLDLENQQLVKNSQIQREQRMGNLADGKDSLEETFNVFEQKIKDQTCIIDLEDLNTITDRLAQKDLDFVRHADTTPPQDVPQELRAHEPDAVVSPAGASLPEEPVMTQEALQPAVEGLETQIRISVRPPEPQTPDANDIIRAAIPVTEPAENPALTAIPVPEEVNLADTIPPAPAKPALHTQPADNLPEITIRGKKANSLEKTFNLETPLDTEAMHSQHEKSFHNSLDLPPASSDAARSVPPQPAAPQAPAQEKPAPAPEPEPIRPAQLEENTGESFMEENIEEKTTFRLRRKIAAPAQPVPPTPQAPVPPAQPAAPVQPAQPTPAAPVQPMPQAPQQPAPQAPVQPAPSAPVQTAAPVQPAPAMPNPVIEKTKTIDHSIELPLSELKKHNWPLEMPMVPTYTLENMVISVNRFAHATAISVIENPGKLYNPLVFHGATGTGKTHFLNAMAYAFSKKYGQENIFMTNGVRLSRGIQRYVMEGNIEKFEKFMDTVKVLLIDDIHLLAINEQNRTHISALLNKFLREQKQIVITSKYPPESLEKLEQLIRFKLDSGWISELKPTAGSTHFKIVKKTLMDNGVDLTDSQITTFFGGPTMTLGTITRSIRRLKVLENLMYPNMPEEDRSQASIFEKLLATTGEDQSSQLLTREPMDITTITPSQNTDWGRIGFFYPQNNAAMMPWMVYALEQRAKELNISGGFEIAVRSSYSTDNIISSAFKIANLCDNKKLKGAVILGPSIAVCEPSVRENFYDILTHMLEIMLIRCGIINAEDAKAPSTYVKVISELMR